jgi:hypothetical protein
MLAQPFVNLNVITGRMFLSPSVIGTVYHRFVFGVKNANRNGGLLAAVSVLSVLSFSFAAS